MKYLLMCEGQNELAVVDILLDGNLLSFARKDLLGLSAYHARQIGGNPQVRMALNIYPGSDVCLLRIGDKLSDALLVPFEYEAKIQSVEKYCTKPELEMLLIIGEGLFSEFQKVKSKTHAKQFAKERVRYNGKRYDGYSSYYDHYFGDRPEFLAEVIREYKAKNGSHRKDELYLADILK